MNVAPFQSRTVDEGAGLSRRHAELCQQAVVVLSDPVTARTLGLDPARLGDSSLEAFAFAACARHAEQVASANPVDVSAYRVSVTRLERAWSKLLRHACTSTVLV